MILSSGIQVLLSFELVFLRKRHGFLVGSQAGELRVHSVGLTDGEMCIYFSLDVFLFSYYCLVLLSYNA